VVALLAAVQYVVRQERERLRGWLAHAPDLVFYPALGAAAATLLYFTPLSSEPFIYFQF
jgi:hypothetical protein